MVVIVVVSPREAWVVIVQGEVEGRGDGLAAGVGRVEAFNNLELHGELWGHVAEQVDGQHHAEDNENEITQAIEDERVTLMLAPAIRRSRFLLVGVVFVKQGRWGSIVVVVDRDVSLPSLGKASSHAKVDLYGTF
jgi:hypothetical protein